jgi:hypothetical protein
MSAENDFDPDAPLLSIEHIRKIKEFSHLSDDELNEIRYMMHLFSVLTFEIFSIVDS